MFFVGFQWASGPLTTRVRRAAPRPGQLVHERDAVAGVNRLEEPPAPSSSRPCSPRGQIVGFGAERDVTSAVTPSGLGCSIRMVAHGGSVRSTKEGGRH
jgi:hypothetical protein